MITYKTGDLLESKADILVNTVNTVGVMGKGIALQFKEKYPKMFEQYKVACKSGELNKGGDLWWWKINPSPRDLFSKKDDGKYVLCFATKENWRKSSKLEWIEKGLVELSTYFNSDYFYEFVHKTSIAFPKLGCNNGGLDWETQVRPLMEKYLNDLSTVDVEIYV